MLAGELGNLADERLTALALDLAVDAAAHGQLSTWIPAGAIVVDTAPPEAGSTRGESHLVACAHAARARRIVYVSSTGVYPPGDGSWTDEDAPVGPTSDQGRARLAAESEIIEGARACGVEAVALRAAGIYGPGRGVPTRLHLGNYRIIGDGDTFVCRIHVDDLVTIVLAAATVPSLPRAVYNVADDEPETSRVYAYAVADILGVPPPPSVPASAVEPWVATMMRANRRIANRRVKEEARGGARVSELARRSVAGHGRGGNPRRRGTLGPEPAVIPRSVSRRSPAPSLPPAPRMRACPGHGRAPWTGAARPAGLRGCCCTCANRDWPARQRTRSGATAASESRGPSCTGARGVSTTVRTLLHRCKRRFHNCADPLAPVQEAFPQLCGPSCTGARGVSTTARTLLHRCKRRFHNCADPLAPVQEAFPQLCGPSCTGARASPQTGELDCTAAAASPQTGELDCTAAGASPQISSDGAEALRGPGSPTAPTFSARRSDHRPCRGHDAHRLRAAQRACDPASGPPSRVADVKQRDSVQITSKALAPVVKSSRA